MTNTKASDLSRRNVSADSSILDRQALSTSPTLLGPLDPKSYGITSLRKVGNYLSVETVFHS